MTSKLQPDRTCLFLCGLLLLHILLAPFASAAEQNAATVIAIRGEVTAIDQQGTTRTLAIKDPIYLEDTIDTGERGRMQIMFTDNTIISLGRKTVIQMLDYSLNAEKKGVLSTQINEGVFRVMGGILTKTSPENFSTKTPSGNIGIRGSLYTGQVLGTNLNVVFEGGKGITVQNNTGTVLITTPGNGIRATGFDSAISEPYRFSPADMSRLHNELATSPIRSDSTRPAGNRSYLPPIHFNAEDAGPPQGGDAATAHQQSLAGSEAPTTTDEGPAEPTDATTDERMNETLLNGIDPLDPKINEIITNVRTNQNEAAAILKNAVTSTGMNVESALSVVLSGMKNTSRDNFDHLMNEAMDMGITVDQAKNIVTRFKASGGVCK